MTATETPGTGLAPYAAPQDLEYRARIVMTPDDAKALDAQLRACTLAVLREGVDYGPIPGTDDRNVLKKPGAEKLLQWFGLVSTCDRVEVEHDSDGRKEGVTYRATVSKQLPDGRAVTVATCEGYAGYDEAKFYRTAEEAQAKAKANERYWAEKDSRPANPNRWNHLTEYRAPWNTIIKMAQKRALVGATVDATAAAGLFSAEDDGEDARTPEPDDGPSLGEQLLGEAATFTTEVAGQRIWREAATAAREGLCTPGQATHIQNRIRVRLKTLQQAARPVYVDDLASQAGENVSPAEKAPSAPPAEPAGEASMPPGEDEAGPTSPQAASPGNPATSTSAEPAIQNSTDDEPPVSTPQLKAIWTLLTGAFAFAEDEKPQARKVCAHTIGRELASTKDMSKAEARTVLDRLAEWRAKADERNEAPRDYLIGVMTAGTGDGDE